MPLDRPNLSPPLPGPDPRPANPIRKFLLWRFRGPEDAPTLRRVGHLLLDLVNEAGQHGPKDDGSSIRSPLLAVAQDLLADPSNLTEIADECGWNKELPEPEGALRGRVEAWAFQLQLIAQSIRETLGVESRP